MTLDQLHEKITFGLQRAFDKLVAEKIRNNSYFVFTVNGKIKHVDPRTFEVKRTK